MGIRKLQRNNFAYLLGGLLSLLLVLPGLRLGLGEDIEAEIMRPFLLIAFSFFTLVSVWSLYQDARIFRVGLTIALVNIGLAVYALFFQNHLLELCAFLSLIAFSVVSCYIAGRHVFSFRDTDTNSLIGAVCVYLLLGLIWGLLYAVLGFLWPQGAFQGLVFDGKTSRFDACLYFSYVTLTTAGYGDITPVNPLVRTFAYLEMIVGQFYMAILVSGLVAHFMGLRMTNNK
jgi:hypothetical protein